jgi:hypothetical protein
MSGAVNCYIINEVDIVWVVTPCGVVVRYQPFRALCCLYLQGEVTGMGENGIDIKGPDWRWVARASSQ